MQAKISSLIATLDSQVGLLRHLEKELVASRGAYASKGLEAIYANLGNQTLLCDKLRRRRAEVEGARQMALVVCAVPPPRNTDPSRGELSSDTTRQLRHVLAELAATEMDVCRLNAEQQAFVDGSLRTLRLLTNALSSFCVTYPEPKSTVFAAAPGVRP